MRSTEKLLRKIGVLACCAGLGLLVLAGCGGGSGASGPQQAVVPQGLADDAGEIQASATAPRNASFTLYCRDFTGENHARVAEAVRKQVQEVTGSKDFYLVRGQERTVLYHGFYATYEPSVDRREAARARSDRDLLARLVDSRGIPIFPRPVFEPLERPDPAAPPEWDLHNAEGHWTLLVATYTNPAEAKQAAVDSVREARKQGVEAYYLHKDGQSHVLIGTWPADAVKRGTSMHAENVRREERGLVDPNNPPTVVVSVGPMDPKWRDVRDRQGRPLELYEMRVELMDPTLKKMYGEYPYIVDGRYEGAPHPLLLEIPPATNRKSALDSKPVDAPPDTSMDNSLLRRY